MNRTRKAWEDRTKGKTNFSDPFGSVKTLRKAREKRATGVRSHFPCAVVSEEINGDVHHQGATGGLVICRDNFIMVKLPYGISANDIRRATIDENGIQRNSLSVSAKKFKHTVFGMYAPIFQTLKWKPIAEPCEVRLLVQPPMKTRNFSALSYPRFDIDNYPKLLIDALKGREMLFRDDNIFISERIEFAKPVENGCVWLSCILIDEKDQNWLEKQVDFDWLAGRVANG